MKTMRNLVCCVLFFVLGLAVCPAVIAASAPVSVQIKVESFTLSNGMLFLVVNRPNLPQVACRLTVKAGSTFEKSGGTGIAHMLEHMLFKGTKNFGTTNLELDLQLQRRIEGAYQLILSEENKKNPDRAKIEKARESMAALREQARDIYVPNVVFTQLGKNGGSNINAMTSNDFTMYTADMPADMLEQWFSLMSEQIFEPEWREFYVEKDVVLREWAYRQANDPAGIAYQSLNAAAYQASPYKNPVIGWLSDIERFSTMAAIDFHSSYYNPNNAVCVLVGNVDVKEAQKLARTYFERYPKGDDVNAYVTREPGQQGQRQVTAQVKGAKTPLVYVGFHGPAFGSSEFYSMDLLSMVLSAGQSSRLQQNLVNTGLLTDAGAYNPDSRFATRFILYGVPALKPLAEGGYDYAKLCEEAKNLLLNEAVRIAREGVTERELNRAKTLARRQLMDILRENGSLAQTLAVYEVYDSYSYLNAYLKELNKVTPRDVREACAKYLVEDNMTVSIVLPGGEAAEAPAEFHETRVYNPGDETEEYVPKSFANRSIYKTPAGWKHPLSFQRNPEIIEYSAAEEFTVNGAKVFYIKDESLPLAEIKILVKAGSVDLPEEKQGLNKIMHHVLVNGGTVSHTPKSVAEMLDDNAVKISIKSGAESTGITLSALNETFESSMLLLGEMLTAPRMDEDVFKAALNQQQARLHMDSGNAQWLAFNAANSLFFAGSPYGRNALNELETMPGITRDDLREFLEAYFTPENMTIAFAGSMERAELERLLDKFTQSLRQTPAPARNVPYPQMADGGMYFIHKPGQVQSQIIFTLPSTLRDDPDFWKLNFLADMYGGSKNALLLTRLRDDLGLAYSAAFWQTENWRTGYFMGWIGCQAAGTGLAVREAAGIMQNMANGLKEADVERHKLILLNGFVFNLDNNFDLAATYAGYALRGADMDTLEIIQKSFAQATAQDLTGLAKTYFDLSKLQIVVVADKNTQTERDGAAITVLEDLRQTAQSLGLGFNEIEAP